MTNVGAIIGSMRVKIIGGSDEHLSRFHSRRGKRAGLAELRGLVKETIVRAVPVVRRATPIPWMAPGAVKFLDAYLGRNMSLLELGSGDSTAWYADRVARITSIEPDPEWGSIVRRRLAGIPNATLLSGLVVDLLPELLHGRNFNVVIIDHKDEDGMSRVDALAAVLERDTHPECIVLDDSDRRAYSEAASLLHGWRRERFSGFRSTPLRMTETTIWVKP